MASWMIHLRIADQLLDQIPGLDETAFVIGNIAPDSGVPNEDWSVYFPPKSVSHYKAKGENGNTFDLVSFVREHFSPEMIRSFSLREFSFFLGYYAHLLTDVEWISEVLQPSFAAHPGRARRDPAAFVWELKRDWYDLDFRYLEEHPDFRAFRIYEQSGEFRNDLMDIFSEDAFSNRRKYICGYYRGEHGNLYREYPWMAPEQADHFVTGAARRVLSALQPSLSAWHESVGFTLKELQPSQFWISERKLKDVRAWFNPSCLSNFAPIPVKILDGIPVMTDGHTRAAAALLAGLDSVPLVWDRDDMDWEMYRECVRACRERKIFSPEDLTSRILPEDQYHKKWDLWCDRMQAEIRKKQGSEQEKSANQDRNP